MKQYRIMSFNVRGSFLDDGENKWELRSKLNYEIIKKYSPDLIGFQELQNGNWRTYENKLTEYGKILGPQYNNSEPFCYPSIFFNPEKFEFIEKGHFWLSESPEVFSSSWETSHVRSALWVRLQYKEQADKTVVFLNTHLDSRSEKARVNGALLIIDKIAKIRNKGESVLISGDFNCEPNSEAYMSFLNSGYKDTFISSGNSDNEQSYTFHNFTGGKTEICHRIDWILALADSSDFKVIKTDIIKGAKPPCYPSDHFPIILDYGVKNV